MSKFVDEGENRIANIILGATPVDSTLYLGLYKNTSEPSEDAVLTDLVEQSGEGYTRIALSRGSWSIVADTSSYAEQTFTNVGDNWGTIYGYFISTTADNTGKLLCVEDFSDGPYSVANGDSIKITPSIVVS